MGLTDKLEGLSNSMQQSAKSASVSIATISTKVITAGVLSLTFALIGQEIFSYGTFAFSFVMVVIGTAFWKLMSPWGIGAVLLFDLFCVLVGILLRMYILIAP